MKKNIKKSLCVLLKATLILSMVPATLIYPTQTTEALTPVSNIDFGSEEIQDVFYYDTSSDPRSGNDNTSQGYYATESSIDDAWRTDNTKSWYNETLDDSGDGICDWQTGDGDGDPRNGTDDRCGTQEFPMKSLVTATNDTVFIFDANDRKNLSLWMKFTKAYDGNGQHMAGTTVTDISSIKMLQGQLFIGNKKTTSGDTEALIVIDFINDTSYNYTESAKYTSLSSFTGQHPTNISDRNTIQAFDGNGQGISISEDINTFDITNINGKIYIAIGFQNNLTLINYTDKTVYKDTTSSGILNGVGTVKFIDNDLYYSRAVSCMATYASYNIDTITTDFSAQHIYPGMSDTCIMGSPPPAAETPYAGSWPLNAISGITNGSTMGTGNHKIMLAHPIQGLVELNEIQGNETNGSSRFTNRDYATMDMPGDIRAHWVKGLQDRSPYSNHLSNNGVTEVNPVMLSEVYGFEFDGSSNVISLDSNNQLDGMNALTLNTWINIDSIQPFGNGGDIIFKGDISDTNTQSYLLQINDGEIQAQINGANSSKVTGAITAGGWHFISYVYDGSNSSLYIDGEITETKSYSGGNIYDNNFDFSMGGSYDSTIPGYTNHIDGTLALPSVTATPLTAEQINNLYHQSAHWFETNTPNKLSGASNQINDIECYTDGDMCILATEAGLMRTNVETNIIETIITGSAIKHTSGYKYQFFYTDNQNKIWSYLDDALVYNFTFDSNSLDESSYRRSITSYGNPTFQSAVLGNGILWDGIDDYSEISNTTAFEVDTKYNEYTISAFIKMSQDDSGYFIFSETEAGSIGGYGIGGPTFFQRPGYGISFYCGHRVAAATVDLGADEWYHLVGVCKNDKTLELYVNGELEDTGTFQYHPHTKMSVMRFGGMDNMNRYAGMLADELRYYRRGLESDEIMNYYLTYFDECGNLVIAANGQTSGCQKITGGELSLIAPSGVNFSNIETAATIQTNNATFPSPVIVQDLRDTNAGFSLTLTATDFITGVNTIEYEQLSFKTNTASSPTASDLTGISSPTTTLTQLPTDIPSISGAMTAMIGSSIQRNPGQWQVTPELQLTIPAFTNPGSYTSTITFTLT